jgi:hypothetical protein
MARSKRNAVEFVVVDRPSDADASDAVDMDAQLAEIAAQAATVDVQALFDDLNARYFDGALPRYTVVRDDEALRRVEHSDVELFGKFSGVLRGYCDDFARRIVINLYDMGEDLTYLLLHEMCHIEQPGRGGHGPIFRERCRKVARQAGIPLARLV